MHVIDPATDTLQGADGVRVGDVNKDGLPDLVTGWEEGRSIRVCLNPGPEKSRSQWPAVTVGQVRSAEDAVFVDLDGDGALDVVSCTEGRDRSVYVHWAPDRTERILDPLAWTTEPFPCARGEQQWMFALPLDVDRSGGVDLVVGSKGKNASVSWLRSPAEPRNLEAWTLHRVVDAGWVMSLRSRGEGVERAPIVVSDRKGKSRGVFELIPDLRATSDLPIWSRNELGGADHEVMFLDLQRESRLVMVATRAWVLLRLGGESPERIPNPFGVPWGKAVALGDIDLDGDLDLVHAANNRGRPEHPGVSWLEKRGEQWRSHRISERGSKFDRLELLDLDGDGDLDVVTCEENAGEDSRGLGVIWFENVVGYLH